jgi:hypothetical protein
MFSVAFRIAKAKGLDRNNGVNQMFKTIMISAAAATCLLSSSAFAATPCSNLDLTPNAIDCSGFYDGNILNDAHIDEQKAALLDLGFVWDGTTIIQTISPLNGSMVVDFDQLLVGVSFIAMHFGNGQGGPGNATAFYKIDAGSGIDKINLVYNASSNAVLYSTGTTPGVPEPATWAMMITGFGLVGVAMRRRSMAFARQA